VREWTIAEYDPPGRWQVGSRSLAAFDGAFEEIGPRIHPPGEVSEGDIEALAWKLCPSLRADDECDMLEILNGPHPECRRCEMGVERDGATAGCRLVANVVARAAISALPAPPEREALKEALALLVEAGDRLEGAGLVCNTLERARGKLGALLGEEK